MSLGTFHPGKRPNAVKRGLSAPVPASAGSLLLHLWESLGPRDVFLEDSRATWHRLTSVLDTPPRFKTLPAPLSGPGGFQLVALGFFIHSFIHSFILAVPGLSCGMQDL